jgi:hypothetical protein
VKVVISRPVGEAEQDAGIWEEAEMGVRSVSVKTRREEGSILIVEEVMMAGNDKWRSQFSLDEFRLKLRQDEQLRILPSRYNKCATMRVIQHLYVDLLAGINVKDS